MVSLTASRAGFTFTPATAGFIARVAAPGNAWRSTIRSVVPADPVQERGQTEEPHHPQQDPNDGSPDSVLVATARALLLIDFSIPLPHPLPGVVVAHTCILAPDAGYDQGDGVAGGTPALIYVRPWR
jgi:hypothetical protein